MRCEAAQVRRLFTLFAETGSGLETAARLREEGVTSKTGRPVDRGDVYKLLANRTYLGEAVHKGKSYPGEHRGIVPRELWDRAHEALKEGHRSRGNTTRNQTPALLKGLLFGADGRALSPTHTRRRGRLYRYYVSQAALKGTAGAEEDSLVRRVPAAQIEALVVEQVRVLILQPEVVVGTWQAARAGAPGLTEAETRDALHGLEPLWDELFPAEQARIVRLLVERVTVSRSGADIRFRIEGLASLVRDLGGSRSTVLEAAE
jgi:hypothetical protein